MAGGGLNFAPVVPGLGSASVANVKLLADGLPLAKSHPAGVKSKAGKDSAGKQSGATGKAQAGPQLAAQFKPVSDKKPTVAPPSPPAVPGPGQQVVVNGKFSMPAQVVPKMPPITPAMVLGTKPKFEPGVGLGKLNPPTQQEIAMLAATTVESGRRVTFLLRALAQRFAVTGSQADAIITQILNSNPQI